MTETVRQTEIDAAKAYEGLMVPARFGEWAPKVADAARILAAAEQALSRYGCRWRRHLRDVRPPRHRNEALTPVRPYLYD